MIHSKTRKKMYTRMRNTLAGLKKAAVKFMITVFRNDSGKFFSFLNSQIQHFITFLATPISLLLVIFVYKNKNAFAESVFVLE